MQSLLSLELQMDIMQKLFFFYPYTLTGRQFFNFFAGISEFQMAVNIDLLIKKGFINPGAIYLKNDIPHIRLGSLHLTEEGFEHTIKYF